MQALRLGRLHGIDVNIHPTFALVLLWVIWDWGFGEGGGWASLLFGLVFVALVFVSVLIHELGHCFMAREYANRVHDITLWPFGGVARIEHGPSPPAAEVMIALAGPAMNLAIAVALLPPLLFLGVVEGLSGPAAYVAFLIEPSPSGLLVYLVVTNLMLVLFNLLPAFPMDGGRVLRAGLASMVGRERATQLAVTIGYVVAGGMAIFGLWIGDVILPIIAVVVMVAAHAEGRAVRVEGAMRRLRVGQFALWDMGGISPHHPLTYALRGGPRDVVVTEGGQVVGMLWRHQLLHGLNGGAAGTTVADVMDRSVYTADIDASLYEVQQQMHRLNRWAVPIIENGHYRGIFTADRFVHIYHQVAPTFADRLRSLGNWSEALRAWVR